MVMENHGKPWKIKNEIQAWKSRGKSKFGKMSRNVKFLQVSIAFFLRKMF